jgi:hypothetical protein
MKFINEIGYKGLYLTIRFIILLWLGATLLLAPVKAQEYCSWEGVCGAPPSTDVVEVEKPVFKFPPPKPPSVFGRIKRVYRYDAPGPRPDPKFVAAWKVSQASLVTTGVTVGLVQGTSTGFWVRAGVLLGYLGYQEWVLARRKDKEVKEESMTVFSATNGVLAGTFTVGAK